MIEPVRHAAIIGAGPVGLSLALDLARHGHGWAVSLFDARPAQADVSGDPRTLALSRGSLQTLTSLGVWPLAGTQVIDEVRVSQDAPALGLWNPRPEVVLRSQDLGVDALGAVTAYGTLVAALQRRWLDVAARQPHRLHTRMGQPVAGLKVVEGPQVEVDAGVVDRFDLAIVAEGGVFLRDRARPEVQVSATAQRRGLLPESWAHDYGQTAWVGTAWLEDAQPGRAIERFSRQGPVALLPLPPERGADGLMAASLVWCVTSEGDPVPAWDDAHRIAVLNSLLPTSAGRIRRLGPLKSFALGLQAQATLVQDDCLVRIGNAAQTLHPVAGQGLNLGLRDAAALVEHLRLMDRRGRTLAQALAAVQTARAPDRWSMIAATDFLARSFTWALPGAATARALGLLAVEHLPGVKPALARQMMFGRR